MESWRRTLSQFRDLFNNMAPGQRMTLVIVPLLVLAGLGLVMYLGVGPAEEALLAGKVFSADELKNAEAALLKGSLMQYRVSGQRILVPKADVARCNAALAVGDAVPEFGRYLEQALETNPFLGMGEPQRRDRVDLAKARELARIIKAIPFVEDASLVPHRPGQRGFSRESKMTAALGVQLKGGRELTGELAQSLRQTVAGGFGMAPADVTVIDTRTGRAPQMPDPNDPSRTGYVEAVRNFTAMYQQTIADALQYIPNVLVSVNVDVDTLMQSHEQERKYEARQIPDKGLEETENETSHETGPGREPGMKPNQPLSVRQQENNRNTRTVEKSRTATDSVPTGTHVADRLITGHTPKSVQVAVAIPKDYYREAALAGKEVNKADRAAFQAKVAQLKIETEKKVRETVAALIPRPASGTAADLINVSSYDRLETADTPIAVSTPARVGEMVTQWGGPAGLALFTLWSLWMLNRSLKRAPESPVGATAARPPAAKPAAAATAVEDESDDDGPKEPTKRDKLQGLVKDNPEMAAAVISRWLGPPK